MKNDIFQFGYKRSERSLLHCLVGLPYTKFRLDPNAIASGHNPETLSGGEQPARGDAAGLPKAAVELPASSESQLGNNASSLPLNSSEVQPADSGGKTPEQMRVELGRIVALDFISKNGYELYQNPIGTKGYRGCELGGLWILRNKEGNFWGMNHQREESVIPEICKEFAKKYDFPASLDAMATAEATLTDEEHARFRMELGNKCIDEHPGQRPNAVYNPRSYISATAMQRAAALLAVKKGVSK